MLDTVWQDLRHAARSLRRTPGFTAVVVLTLALGIGANTAIFSLMDAVVFRPLPVTAPEELSLVYSEGPAAPGDVMGRLTRGDIFSWPLVQQFKQAVPPGVRVAAMTPPTRLNARLGTDPATTLVLGQLVSGEFFSTFGASPAIGRLLSDSDNRTLGDHPVVVLGYGFWQRQFAGAPDAIGRTIPTNGVPFTVVGVANPGFTGIWVGSTIDLWVPLVMQQPIAYRSNAGTHSAEPNLPWPPQAGVDWLNVVVRSAPERVTRIQTAFAELYRQQMRQLGGDRTDNPELRGLLQRQVRTESFVRGFSILRDQYSNVLMLLMGMVGLLLVTACANVANLLLARSAARQREFAIRVSLGAGRLAFVRQLLIESLLLATLGGLTALIVAQWAGTTLASFALAREVLPAGFALDGRVLAFCALVSVGTSIVFGLVPALRATSLPPASALKATGTGGGHATGMRPLVAAQIALSLVLVIGAGLFGRSLLNLWTMDPGYDRDHVVQIRINPRVGGISREELPAVYEKITRQARQVPGALAADVSFCGIASGCRSISGITVEGYQPAPGEIPRLLENRVGATYFATTGMSMVEGRAFTDRDAQGQPEVAVVNEAAARRYFGNASPIGKRIGYGELTTEIVGVVRDARVNALREAPVPMAFYSIAQSSERQFATSMDVRVSGDPAAIGETVRRAVAATEPRLLANERPVTIAEQLDRGLTRDRLIAYLTSAFGLLALLLACVGLYGVLSYTVERRTSEIGVRVAIGATPADVLRLIIGDGMRVTVVGTAAGLVAAVAGARAIETLLFRITSTDPSTYVAITATLMAVALLASYLPARRATRIDPMTALRVE